MLENQIEAQLWTQVDANNAQCQNKQVCTSKSAVLILTNFDQFFHFKVPLATIYALHLSALTQLSANLVLDINIVNHCLFEKNNFESVPFLCMTSKQELPGASLSTTPSPDHRR